jgi:hypothetical protein
MAEVQHAIRLTGVFAVGQLGGDVLDAIVFEMFHEQTVTYDNAINVEEE